MKKSILQMAGLAATAALLCVTCGDSGLGKNTNTGGLADGFVDLFDCPSTQPGCAANPPNNDPCAYGVSPTCCASNPDYPGCSTTPGAYTVTFNTNGGTGTPPDARTVNPGSGITLPNGNGLSMSGYAFDGWNTESSGTGFNYSANSSYTPFNNITLYVKWVRVYAITFDANSGTVSRTSDTTKVDGTLASLPTPAKSCYSFNGWYTTATGGTQVTTSTVFNANATVYAHWTQNTTITTFKDSRDNKTYNKVTIGTQTWMAENLNWETADSKCYENSADSCAKYGRLYTWEDAKTACPAGWRLPDTEEWQTLVGYAGNIAGRKLKSINSGNGTDEYGFSALPGGGGYSDGGFYRAGYDGYWWSATENDASNAWHRSMYYSLEYVSRDGNGKSGLFSVRCLQD